MLSSRGYTLHSEKAGGGSQNLGFLELSPVILPQAPSHRFKASGWLPWGSQKGGDEVVTASFVSHTEKPERTAYLGGSRRESQNDTMRFRC